MAGNPAIALHEITKSFGETVALDRVTFEVPAGTVHGLVGENGAGKSTLMKVLYGLVRPDEGRVAVLGNAMRLGSTPAARAAGVGMVHQHFAQAPSMTVLENLALAAPGMRARPLDLRSVGRRAQDLARSLGFGLELSTRIDKLSVGARQRIEIVKALQSGARVLVLDEPTAVLAPAEIADLIAMMRALAGAGTTVVFVSHKLLEVVQACDDVTVMRRGRIVARFDGATVTPREIAHAMTGEELRDLPVAARERGPEVIEVVGLAARDDRGVQALRGADLRVHAGEVVGIAGIEGNGQEELIEVLGGLRSATSGRVAFAGRDVTGLAPRGLRSLGLAHVPADRLATGTAGALSIADNLASARYSDPPFSRRRIVNRREFARNAASLIERFDVRGATPSGPISRLSGGNLQKVVVARETAKLPVLLLVAHPTRGVDLGAIDRIHRHLLELRRQGAAILLLSSELDEIMALSDRILVMFGGRITAELDPAATNDAEIGAHMTGTAGR